MTGGSFGGSVSHSPTRRGGSLPAEVTEAYIARTGRDGTGYVWATADARVTGYQRWCTCGAMCRR